MIASSINIVVACPETHPGVDDDVVLDALERLVESRSYPHASPGDDDRGETFFPLLVPVSLLDRRDVPRDRETAFPEGGQPGDRLDAPVGESSRGNIRFNPVRRVDEAVKTVFTQVGNKYFRDILVTRREVKSDFRVFHVVFN